MTKTNYLAQVITSCAVMCIAASAFAQNHPTPTKSGGEPNAKSKMEDISKCPVIGGTLKPASERNTAAGAMLERCTN